MPSVELRGNADLRKAMRRFTPELEKQLRVELTKALKPIAKLARTYVPDKAPMRGWQARSFSDGNWPQWNTRTVQKGIGYSVIPSKINRYGFSSMANVHNHSAVGAIYETSGRTNPRGQEWVGPKAGGTSKGVSRANWKGAGEQFIYNLFPLITSVQGRGRLIYKAWRNSQNMDPVGVAMRAIDSTTTEFYKRAQYTSFKAAA